MQPPGDLDVLPDGCLPIHSRALEYGGQPLQARFAEEGAHPLAADLAVRDRGVAVPVGPARIPGIIYVQQLELLEADLRVDLVDEVPHALGRADVVAGRV